VAGMHASERDACGMNACKWQRCMCHFAIVGDACKVAGMQATTVKLNFIRIHYPIDAT
jgi:hypothetical protein